MVNFGDQVNLSREELDKMRRRKEIRQRLKHEFYAYYRNPLQQSYMIDTYDPAQQRLNAAQIFCAGELAKTYKTRYTFIFFGIVVGIPTALASIEYYRNKDWLKKVRTGEVTLEERMKARLVNGV